MNREIPKLISFKKAFGKQNYLIKNDNYKEKILNHPLFNDLYSIGRSFVIIANTSSWEIVAVTGDSEGITGYKNDEIFNLGGEFVLSFSIQEHLQLNLATAKACMEYSNSIPSEQREFIFAVYYYHGRKKNGDIIPIQHKSIPMVFDENHIPFVFCNIYSDISYLDPQNIPHGIMLNKFTQEVFHLNKENFNLEKGNEKFSKREKEIIRHISSGQTSKQIAEKLNISTETVRTHRKNILRKAGVSNTISLVKYSVVNGIF
jgi:DNA-binding CsgD family transcriptional regulator